MVGFFGSNVILFILFAVVAANNGTCYDDDLCCHVREMSNKCSSRGNTYNTHSSDIEALRREIASLKDLLTWYKARNGKFYKVFKEWTNYTRAMARCVEEGGQLVIDGIRNTDTRSELESLIKAGGENTWIGLTDLKDEGKWCWNDHVIANMAQIKWSPYQPDDHKGGEDCAHYWKEVGWYVNDASCGHRMHFLCEKE